MKKTFSLDSLPCVSVPLDRDLPFSQRVFLARVYIIARIYNNV